MADYRKRYKSHETDYDYVMSRTDAELCYSLSKKEVATILALTDYIGWKTRWVSPSGAEIEGGKIREIEAAIEFALMNPVTCGEPEEQECFTYLPNAPFIEWFPHDPFYEPDKITEGYLAPAWYVANQSEKTVMTDLSRFPTGSLPTILPASGLPRFRVWLSSETAGIIELHMFSIIQGSLAQVTIDDNPLTIQLLDLNKDLVALPPETVGSVILELTIPAGDHHIDVIIISQLDTEAPYLRHGGGLRQIVLCGLGAGKTMIKPQFRFTAECGLEVSTDGGTEWESVPGWETYAQTCFKGADGEPGTDADLSKLCMRFDGCLLQYSINEGSMWHVVDGWTDWLTCLPEQPEMPVGLDKLRVRFDGCLLQYSINEGSMWQVVDGWTDWLTCIPEPPDQLGNLQFRLLDCGLEYSKDGGGTWTGVPGWNTLTECFTSNADVTNAWRCRSAKAAASEFCAKMVDLGSHFFAMKPLGYGPTFQLCSGQFGLGAGARFTLNFDALWNDTDPNQHAFFDALQVEDNARYLAADMLYSLEQSGTGEWTYNAVENLYFRLQERLRPIWEINVADWFRGAYYDDERSFDAWCWQSLAYAPEWPCEQLEDIQTSTLCHKFDFSQGADEWYVYVGQAVAGGIKTVPYQPGVDYLDIGLGLSSYDASWASLRVQSIFDATTNGQLTILAVVSGQLIQLAQYDQETGGDNTVALPPDATQLSIRASCGSGSVYVLATYLTYSSAEEIWLQNCE